jgi:hypothetical protein
MKPQLSCAVLLISVSLCLTDSLSAQADPPKVLELRVQKVNGVSYFHLRLESPKDMVQNPVPRGRFLALDADPLDPSLQP